MTGVAACTAEAATAATLVKRLANDSNEGPTALAVPWRREGFLVRRGQIRPRLYLIVLGQSAHIWFSLYPAFYFGPACEPSVLRTVKLAVF